MRRFVCRFFYFHRHLYFCHSDRADRSFRCPGVEECLFMCGSQPKSLRINTCKIVPKTRL